MVLWLLFRPPFLATGRAASSGRGPSAWAQIHGSFTKRTQGDVRRRSFSHRTQRESAAMMLTHTPYGDHPLVTRRGSRVISVLIVTPFYNEYRVTCRLNCSILFLFLYCGLWLWSLQRAQVTLVGCMWSHVLQDVRWLVCTWSYSLKELRWYVCTSYHLLRQMRRFVCM